MATSAIGRPYTCSELMLNNLHQAAELSLPKLGLVGYLATYKLYIIRDRNYRVCSTHSFEEFLSQTNHIAYPCKNQTFRWL